MTRRTLICLSGVLTLLLPASSFAALIGQSQPEGTEPIPWTDCAWCVADTNGTVYLPGGWCIASGTRTAKRMRATVSGRLFTNGSSLFAWDVSKGTVSRVRTTDGGLASAGVVFRPGNWKVELAFAPDGCRQGFAADGRFFAYDRDSRKVSAFRADGTGLGSVLDVAAFGYRTRIMAIAVHPPSGDFIVQTDYPESRAHRIRRDGTEVRDGVWPQPLFGAGFTFVGDELWACRKGAHPVRERLGGRNETPGGEEADETHGVAWGGDGWWLATTQGALFYSAQDPKRCLCRIGGVSGVTALAVTEEGEVIASAGNRILAFWLDDGPDDAPHSCANWMWSLGGRWANDRVSSVVRRDGLLFLREENARQTWALDLSVIQWVRRDRRMYVTNEVFAASSADARCRNWQVSYDAKRHALVRQDIQ